jgi:Co/Zn/Cd efflux system component
LARSGTLEPVAEAVTLAIAAPDITAASLAIIAAGLITAYARSICPDLVIGLAIAAMNVDAAREVCEAARDEHRVSDRGRVNH